MKKSILIYPILFATFLAVSACKEHGPYKMPYNGAVGTVIAKETCNTDTTKDYWLIEIYSASSQGQQFGDKLSLNGITYTNAIKTADLHESLKKVGQKVGFDFTITGAATSTPNCNITGPKIYTLKIAEFKHVSPAVF